jgi:hypothetical protein
VTGLPGKLQQSRCRTAARLGAFAATQTAGELVHEGGRWVLHGGQIDVTRRLGAGALDLQPRKAALGTWWICAVIPLSGGPEKPLRLVVVEGRPTVCRG